MRIWPFGKAEHRSVTFTDGATGAAMAAATGSGLPGRFDQLAAVETAVGLWGRGFASATVTPEVPALTPAVLESMGRSLALKGEGVYVLDTGIDGALVLRACSAWEIHGGSDPALWVYNVTIPGPSRVERRVVTADRLTHIKYATRPGEPWRGVSPLGMASQTRDLATWLERKLTQEVSSSSGYLLPIPDGAELPDTLKATLRNALGGLVVLESVAAGWGQGKEAAPREDWEVKRFGANPPDVLAKLRQDTRGDVLAAYGIPSQIHGTGGSARESYRQFLGSTIQPLAKLVVESLKGPLNVPDLALTFETLRAADITGRARAYGVLISARYDEMAAREATGLD